MSIIGCMNRDIGDIHLTEPQMWIIGTLCEMYENPFGIELSVQSTVDHLTVMLARPSV